MASEEQIAKTVQALETNGFQTSVVETGEDGREKVLAMIQAGAAVYTSPSRMLDQIGLSTDFNDSSQFISIRKQIQALDRATQYREIRRLGASPDVYVGSVHAITEHGQVLIASATGSQLGASAWGAGQMIWVVGSQKLVRSIDEGFRRIRE